MKLFFLLVVFTAMVLVTIREFKSVKHDLYSGYEFFILLFWLDVLIFVGIIKTLFN